ncbi:hypothetical protein [Nisaea sediminum]|uniref:hypothetical protein n=1 Tax=Nisaea sediminum TaxID=2775867 RepID=UPI0018678797|nr:hypothetical protein [Nisaea sediminum]
MALPPSGPGNGGVGDIRGRVQRPAVRRPARVAPAEETPRIAPSAPERGFRLRTATTDADIDRQIARLMTLIANDNIDPDAPPGSYINFLI